MIKNTDLNIGPISTDNIDLPITEWTKPMICIIFHHGSDSDPAQWQDSWITDLDWSGSQILVKKIVWIMNPVQDQSETNAPYIDYCPMSASQILTFKTRNLKFHGTLTN